MGTDPSPGSVSRLYPDRAIRPLPKNPLKSRLSPEQASSIVYPPDPPPLSPALRFGGHDTVLRAHRMANGESGKYLHHHPSTAARREFVNKDCACCVDGDSGDDEVEFDHPEYRYANSTGLLDGALENKVVMDNIQRRLIDAARVSTRPPPPGSTASSADGYESFENTSNKKKRKIPLPVVSNLHQSQLSADMASMGISGVLDRSPDACSGAASGAVGAPSRHASSAAGGSSGTGISGAGRGRYGRQSGRNDPGIRRPLGNSSMSALNGSGSHLLRTDAKNLGVAGQLRLLCTTSCLAMLTPFTTCCTRISR